MVEAIGDGRQEEIRSANVDLQGWLQRMFNARQALQEAVAGRQHANFGEMIQGFNEVPEGASIEVRADPEVMLKGRRYDSLTRQSMGNGNLYYPGRPFTGGALVLAKIHEVTGRDRDEEYDPEQATIGLSFHCLRPGPYSSAAGIAFNQILDGVFIPGKVPFEAALSIVDAPPIIGE